MNPFSEASWLWRAWRGHSVTFAALFALGLLGISVTGWLRHLLGRLGAPWFFWLLFPMVLVALLARKETEWLPEEAQRRKCARWLVIGSILFAVISARFAPSAPPAERGPAEPIGRARVERR